MKVAAPALLFALGASAGVAHRRHQHIHDKRALGDVVTATIDGKVVQWLNNWDGQNAVDQPTAAAAAPAEAAPATTTPESAPVVAAEAAPSDSDASGDSDNSGDSDASADVSTDTSNKSTGDAGNSGVATDVTPFCSGNVNKRATLAEIKYKGNTGAGAWGCNMQLVSTSIANQYDYTLKFSAQGSDSQQCVCWNKMGPTGVNDGAFGHSAVSFKVSPGADQVVAVDTNTQGACACSTGEEVPKDPNGQWAATWVEFDMANESNQGWSGGDISALVPQTAGMAVQGMSVCTDDSSQCSRLSAHATTNDAAYVAGMEAVDGVGLNLVPGNVHLNVIAGYTG